MGKKRGPRSGGYPYEVYRPGTLRLEAVDLVAEAEDRRAAEAELLDLQERLSEQQVRAWLKGDRAVVVLEGWDAAGKGGAIKRLTALLDPRGYKVWPAVPPTPEERELHWLWRHAARMPPRGTLAVFDTSWYARVLGDRVEERVPAAAWRRAYDEINAFERMHTDAGVKMVKLFLHLDAETQLQRFELRAKDPHKRFKVSEVDWRHRKRRRAYLQAYQEAVDRTHRPDAPWVLVAAHDKRLARLEVLRTVLGTLGG